MSPEEFKVLIASGIKACKTTEEKKAFVDSYMEGLKEGLRAVGVGVVVEHIQPKINKKDLFIDMLKSIANSVIEEVIEENIEENPIIFDEEEKQIGDRVLLTNLHSGAFMHEYETKEQLSVDHNMPNYSFLNEEATVVGFEDFIFKCGHCAEDHKSDTVIYFESIDAKFHVLSSTIKVINKN